MSEMIRNLKEVYDLEACKYILQGGCISGAASSHIYYSQTVSFYDMYEEEVIELVMNTMGDNYPACLFVENEYSIVSYKNAMVWCVIESYAYDQLLEQSIKEYELS